MKLSEQILIAREIQKAITEKQPIVALETAVITHGLPYPSNLEMAYSVETLIRDAGAIPATIGLHQGKIRVGLPEEVLTALSNTPDLHKISTRNLGIAFARNWSGGTTVAATMHIANLVGIKVFATGGIGGVHRGNSLDISADIPELGRTPMVVVCAGAKAILDLPATLEVLETNAVPVIGFKTDELPAFYSAKSGLPVDLRLDSPAEIAQLATQHWSLGLSSALLVCNPPPSQFDFPLERMNAVIDRALKAAEKEHISGPQVTPFLLDQVRIQTGGESLRSNIALLENNARLAAEISIAMSKTFQHRRAKAIV